MALSSLVSRACPTLPPSSLFTPANLRRSQEPVAAGVRCLATRSSTKKQDNAVSKAALVDLMVSEGKFETKVAADSAVSAGSSGVSCHSSGSPVPDTQV